MITKVLTLLLLSLVAHAEVRNPNVFIGEVINGATNGAPLSAGTTGLLASGISNTEVSATGATTTTSASDGVMNTMTVTPVAGTYLVLFSTWCSHSTGNATITFSIYNNGVQKTDSVRTIIPFNGGVGANTQDIEAVINGVVTATGAGAVTIQWKTSAGTATCTQRTMNLVRLQ